MGELRFDAALAALFGTLAISWFGLRLAHPRRSPTARMNLYLENPRVSLGGRPSPSHGVVVAGEALKRVLGPLAGGVLKLADRALRTGPPESVELKLRQAGLPMTVEAYRREYLRWLILTPLVLGAVGAAAGRAVYVFIFFAAGVFAGSRRLPERVRAATRRRRERIRGDLPAVAGMVALKIENNKSLIVAVSGVVSQGSGPVIDELGRALHLVNAGYGETAAFELAARETPEPAAARFYRFLAAATGGGLDLASALLDQANELRTQRREEVERAAARRQMSLVIPNLVFMAPVLFVFLLAPLPQLLFGK
ncbi:MAG TPA: type II secretion system F family protein [Acidimicrobiales bacterium]|nr:type II secretion system F family protein [Acidimicrobiales bacterium]